MQLVQYRQTEPSRVWVIRHNLGRLPIVQVLDEQNCVVTAAMVSLNPSTVTIEFTEPAVGSVQII
jgi:hypothetical protein